MASFNLPNTLPLTYTGTIQANTPILVGFTQLPYPLDPTNWLQLLFDILSQVY